MMDQFGQVRPPVGVVGNPTRIYECEVVTVNPGGTVSVQKRNSRAGRHEVAVPDGYTPVIGDRVLVMDLDGDQRKPVIAQVVTSAYEPPAPNATAGTLAQRPASGMATGDRYFATDAVADYCWTGAAWLRVSEPVGKLCAFAGDQEPSGWKTCFGQAVPRTGAYADLFDAISDTYGAGNGTTTFNLPDLRGRVPFGLDNMGSAGDAGRLAAANVPGGSGGSETHTLTTGEIPAHAHDIQRSSAQANSGGTGGIFGLQQNSGTNVSATQTNSGGGGAHNNMPPYLLTFWAVKL
jgi:microcystin-dependent protein